MLIQRIVAYGITAILIFTILPAVIDAETVKPVPRGSTDYNRDINYIYSEYSKELLLHNEWTVKTKGARFKAFHYDRYNNRHSLLIIDIVASQGEGYDLFNVTTKIGERTTAKGLKIPDGSKIPRDRLLKDIIVTYLVMKTFDFRKETQRKSEIAYHPSLSFGYVHTSDPDKLLPEYRDSIPYIAASVIYDPTLELMDEKMHLSTGDYMSIDLFVAFDGLRIKENYLDMNMLLYGNVHIPDSRENRFRLLHGFFAGIEYMRPSYDVNTMKLSGTITEDSIAVQYLIVKILQYGFVTSFGTKYNQALSLMAGIGPSVNSSLVATVKPTAAQPQSDIFINLPTEQNYYYGISFPLTLSYKVDRVYGFSMGMEYDFYYFSYWDLSKDANDIINVLKFELGYNIIDNFFINARYEHWHILSKIANVEVYHSWDRIFLELKYRI